jgi:hypothetical protein
MADWKVTITTKSNVIKHVVVEDCVNYRDAIAEAESRTGGKCKGNMAVSISEREKNKLLGKESKSSGKSGGPCFVATTAFGDENHPDVVFLKHFRDKVLVDTKPGRWFIRWYYENGPKLSAIIGKSIFLKKLSRKTISIITFTLRKKFSS